MTMDLTKPTPAQAAVLAAYAQIAPWLAMTGALTPSGSPHDPASAQPTYEAIVRAAGTAVDPTSAAVTPLFSIPYLTGVYRGWETASGIAGSNKWSPTGLSYNTYVPPTFAPSNGFSNWSAESAAEDALALLRADPAATAAVSQALVAALGVNLGAVNPGDADHAGANGSLALRQSVINARWLARETGADAALSVALGGDVSQNAPLPALVWPWVAGGVAAVAGLVYLGVHRAVTADQKLGEAHEARRQMTRRFAANALGTRGARDLLRQLQDVTRALTGRRALSVPEVQALAWLAEEIERPGRWNAASYRSVVALREKLQPAERAIIDAAVACVVAARPRVKDRDRTTRDPYAAHFPFSSTLGARRLP